MCTGGDGDESTGEKCSVTVFGCSFLAVNVCAQVLEQVAWMICLLMRAQLLHSIQREGLASQFG